jgi:hypothetical protein
MALNQEQLSYSGLIEALSKFVREQRTGTMFIVTDSKHSARICLEAGRIVSCTYTLYRGLDAVIHIRHIKGGSYTFSDGIFNSSAEIPLPSTQELLQDLGMSVLAAAPKAPDKGKQASQPTELVGSSDLAVSGSALWTVVVVELASYLGPVASLAAGEYEASLRAATSKNRVQSILATLALEVLEPAQAKEFKERIMARISA